MNSVSISQLKINPSDIVKLADDFPVAVEKRNKIKAYLIGKELYEKIVSFMENNIDKKRVNETDFSKGKNFKDLAKELDL